MNKKRREELKYQAEQLEKIITNFDATMDELMCVKEEVDCIRSDEEDAFDNLPEQFQDGVNGEIMQENISELEDIYNEMDSKFDEFNNLINDLGELKDRIESLI